MEILLWLAPAALATLVTAVLAGRAAGREEDERLRRLATRLEVEAARDADRRSLEELDGVSAPRPASGSRAAPQEAPRQETADSAPHDLHHEQHERRTA